MPNWCVGTLKVRGKKEDIERFALEGLEPIDFVVDKIANLSLNEFGDIDYQDTCYIIGTRRGFAKGVEIYLSYYEDYEEFVALIDVEFAWGISAEELLKICKKYNVDMRIHAFERGMEFNQIIEIVNGEITQDEELHFKDYAWECVCPTLGG